MEPLLRLSWLGDVSTNFIASQGGSVPPTLCDEQKKKKKNPSLSNLSTTCIMKLFSRNEDFELLLEVKC